MKIERRFEPDLESLDRVVDILYRLLVELPPESEPEGTAESSCLSTEYE